jgi:Ca2+-binding EF-hand superfamily protein
MPCHHPQSLPAEYRLCAADEVRFCELFKKLDINGDGRIDIHDLSEALRRLSIPQLPDHAQVSSLLLNQISSLKL